MKHLLSSWLARAVVSVTLVAATVSASYGHAAITVSDLQRKQGS
jgi:hypothetical protein